MVGSVRSGALGKGDFLGRDALAATKEAGPQQRLCLFTLEERAELFGAEPILHEDRVVGIVTSGGYGHRVGKTIALAYLPVEETQHEVFAIAAFGKEFPVKRHSRAVYDPERQRVLG